MNPPSPPGSPSYPNRAAFEQAVCDFINLELPAMSPKMLRNPGVNATTALFATGIIDSMAILHLIAFVERATGRDITTDKVVMKHFQTVTAIGESFWTERTA